jgi:hypothetical protein
MVASEGVKNFENGPAGARLATTLRHPFLFDAIGQLMAPPRPGPPTPEIGFHVKEDAVHYRTKRKSSS